MCDEVMSACWMKEERIIVEKRALRSAAANTSMQASFRGRWKITRDKDFVNQFAVSANNRELAVEAVIRGKSKQNYSTEKLYLQLILGAR